MYFSMYWANFLHFYQPPTQKKYWIDRITQESYRRLVEGLLKTPQAKVTFNINSVLVEFWEEYGYQDVIDGLRKLLERGQIELTASAKYHPLLPKMPKSEIIRQVKLNDETHKKYFGEFYQPQGFFPPEMAYNQFVGKIISELGFKWVVIDELSHSRKEGKVDYNKMYQEKGLPLSIFFRDRHVSYRILAGYLGTPKLFLDEIKEWRGKQGDGSYLLTGMDGETFGHHRPGMDKLFFELYKVKEIEPILLSELHDLYKDRVEEMETLPSTWALMEHELVRKIPFARWDDPQNEIHQLQWEMTELALKTVGESKSKARKLLDLAVHSDQYWWASAKPWWSIEMIERGAKELLDAVEALPEEEVRSSKLEAGKSKDANLASNIQPPTSDRKITIHEAKEKARELYYQILETAFEWQRSGKVEEISRKEDEIIRARTDEGFHQLDVTELNKMIDNIKQEMEEVAEKQEFERATQLRDRIKELESYKTGKDIKGRI